MDKLNSTGETGQDLEGVFARVCALDKCLAKIRTAQLSMKTKQSELSPDLPKEEISIPDQKVLSRVFIIFDCFV